MDLIHTYLGEYGTFIQQALRTDSTLGAVPRSAISFFATAIFRQCNRSVVVITSSNTEAERIREEASLFLTQDMGGAETLFFPGHENLPYGEGGISSAIITQRVCCLDKLLRSPKPNFVFTSADAVLRSLPSKGSFYKLAFHIELEQEYPPRKLLNHLVSIGYHRVDRVEVPGEACLKGSVLDIFPVNLGRAIRIDYFDDLIESIRFFDTESQCNEEVITETKLPILPSSEVILDAQESLTLITELKQASNSTGQKIPLWANTKEPNKQKLAQLHHPGIENFFSLVKETGSIWDYFPESPLVLLYPGLEVKECFSRIRREFEELYQRKKQENVFCLKPKQLLNENSTVNHDNWVDIGPYGNMENGISDTSDIHGSANEVRQKIKTLLEAGKHIILSSAHSAQLQRIDKFLQTGKDIMVKHCQNIKEVKTSAKKKTIYLLRSQQAKGFSIPKLAFYLITDSEIFGSTYRRQKQAKKTNSTPISSFIDLKEGDHIIHLTHGLGRFCRLERVKAMDKERDYLLIEYANKARLYVPLDQISLVQKYLAPTEKPRLDSLGKASFKKVKERVKAKVEEMAKELLRLQAIRMSHKGYSFPADTAWQEEFEETFPYDETPDQITAIEAVKQDMESPQPMDRLICGDVGYGKTEIAIRAVFKAVLSGRQAAIIAPTTILALQHYRNLKQRFANYPIRLDWISRFRTKAEIRKINQALKDGEIDLIIGTHALLANNIQITRLGLLIIDEEQRFGVSHKEAIKRLRSLVDVLALSATPIPRTLHMALVGIRDLSVVETPPQERLPIQTYVMEDNESIIREAILREKQRGGQVFFLHNRVATIESTAERVMEIVPEASFAVLHGQMEEEAIEDTLVSFHQNQGFDVLITTSIIENGIDMPNVNTLIVDRSELLGLSQLYQLRGRVGRSSKQAYAYFLYPRQVALSETTQKRLNTLLEYQELGSGFKVAMRDLEIRGAGNVLGAEQSGHIIEVGYELYLKMLDDAMQEQSGKAIHTTQRCNIQLDTDFYLSDAYISDTRQKIDFYKRFEAAESEEEVSDLAEEMRQRFGSFHSTTKIFINLEKIRTLAQQAGFIAVQLKQNGQITLRSGENFHVTQKELLRCLQENPLLSVRAGQNDTLFYRIRNQNQILEELLGILRELLGTAHKSP